MHSGISTLKLVAIFLASIGLVYISSCTEFSGLGLTLRFMGFTHEHYALYILYALVKNKPKTPHYSAVTVNFE